jgi:acetyltransferase-like isoleucine patch superfamily enzyme
VWHKPGRGLSIGRYCSIAPGVRIYLGGNHRLNFISTYPFRERTPNGEALPVQEESNGDVTIGHDVWIGQDAVILSGVTVGSGAVIGTRSVVTRDVSPFSIVAGNPARHRRFRIPEHYIPDLLDIAWWDWPHEDVLEARHLLLSESFERFIEWARKHHAPVSTRPARQPCPQKT